MHPRDYDNGFDIIISHSNARIYPEQSARPGICFPSQLATMDSWRETMRTAFVPAAWLLFSSTNLMQEKRTGYTTVWCLKVIRPMFSITGMVYNTMPLAKSF
jgi:hypothetical protein